MVQQSQLLLRSASKGKAPAVSPSSPHLGKRSAKSNATTDISCKKIILSADASSSPWVPSERPEKRPRIDAPADVHEQGEDLINQLPDHLLIRIFGYIPAARDRSGCAGVSRKWFVMQALMLRSDYLVDIPKPLRPEPVFSRRITGDQVSGVTLAFMAISMGARGTLADLRVVGSALPAPTQLRIRDTPLSILAYASSGLKSINLVNCPEITSRGIQSLADHCVALEKLHLCNVPCVTDEGLEHLARKCTKMASLQFVSLPKITNRALHAFAVHSMQLGLFHVEACPLVTGDGIISIVTLQPKLEALTISSMELGDFVLKSIARFGGHIKWLKLEAISGVSAVGYRWMGALKRLENLLLTSCLGLTDSSFYKILPVAFSRLKQLVICDCPALSDAGLVGITRSATRLECLALQKCYGFTCRGLMFAIANCTGTLRMLGLMQCNFTRTPWGNVFPICLMMQTAWIDSCRGLDDGFLLWMGESCKRIKNVSFTNMYDITDGGVRYFMDELGPFNRICRMNLAGSTGIGNRSVCAVTKNCDRLKYFNLKGCRRVTDHGVGVITRRCTDLVALDVGGCNIGDVGVARLAKHLPVSLTTISLAGCTRVTDRSVVDLKRGYRPRLQTVNLAGCTGVTAELVKSLRRFFRTVEY